MSKKIAPEAASAPEYVTEIRVGVIALEDLRVYSRNSRVHSADQIDQIVASIREFGWTNPMLVDLSDDGLIVAGHGRRAAAHKIYSAGGEIRLTDGRLLPPGTVPFVDCSGWTEEQRRAYTIADNKLAENATWDQSLLKLELGEISLESGFDIGLIGFSSGELDKILAISSSEGGRIENANDPDAEWRGMPEFDQQDKTAFRTIPVHFKDQEAVDAFAKAIGQKITEKTRFVWFPEIEIERYADKRYEATGE